MHGTPPPPPESSHPISFHPGPEPSDEEKPVALRPAGGEFSMQSHRTDGNSFVNVLGAEPCTAQPIPRIGVIGDPAAATQLVGRVLAEKTAWSAQLTQSWLEASTNATPTDAQFDVVLLIDRATADLDEGLLESSLTQTLEALRACHVPVAVITRRPLSIQRAAPGAVAISADASPERLSAVLETLIAVRPALACLANELSNIQCLGRQLQGHYHHLDQDLYLASRLQHDFLPRNLPEVGAVRFNTYYRPCSLVSGDIFDVFRLDETNVGFFLADAVGHGVAAGLLTMFVKHAIRPKRVRSDGYELIPPSDVLAHLNDHLIAQRLPESQFVTAWYGRINVETMRMDFAVAGHPPALLIDAHGEIQELHGDGCLLGVFESQPFTTVSFPLEQGQRVIIYSDGLESTLIEDRLPSPALPIFAPGISKLLRQPAGRLLDGLQDRLDTTPGGLTHADDVSMIVVDILDPTGTMSDAVV